MWDPMRGDNIFKTISSTAVNRNEVLQTISLAWHLYDRIKPELAGEMIAKTTEFVRFVYNSMLDHMAETIF